MVPTPVRVYYLSTHSGCNGNLSWALTTSMIEGVGTAASFCKCYVKTVWELHDSGD